MYACGCFFSSFGVNHNETTKTEKEITYIILLRFSSGTVCHFGNGMLENRHLE